FAQPGAEKLFPHYTALRISRTADLALRSEARPANWVKKDGSRFPGVYYYADSGEISLKDAAVFLAPRYSEEILNAGTRDNEKELLLGFDINDEGVLSGFSWTR